MFSPIPLIIMTAVIGIMPGFVRAQPASEPTSLLQLERLANELCRGSSGGASDTMEVCAVRDDLDRRLRARGLCYGAPGQIGAEMRWHHCALRERK